MKPNFIVLIPARYGSTRFPGKPLSMIHGKAMIMHVLDRARQTFDQVFVATDDHRIADLVNENSAQAILTASTHRSGTERCAEAACSLDITDEDNTIILNIQGDEPFIPSSLLKQLASAFEDPTIEIATCIHPITDSEDIQNPNRVKVVRNLKNQALYFSRAPIPFDRDSHADGSFHYQHIGIYGYRFKTLQELVKLPFSVLEKREALEQLRWLEHGYSIHCIETNYNGFGIDTEEDLRKAELIKGEF